MNGRRFNHHSLSTPRRLSGVGGECDAARVVASAHPVFSGRSTHARLPAESVTSSFGVAWQHAGAALREVTSLNVTTAAYRMALMRALMLYECAMDLAVSSSDKHRLQLDIEALERNLEVDWRHVLAVEIRYADDSTEIVNLKVDPEAARKFQEAKHFRLIGNE
ncbi:hypothetical protein [Demequina oxidasica]|uniref:hypothetical protein n=1 Tax=Demequina oxidasica TaxID=676199 RepID=UPI000781859B|nr:hypothetical protein [Demequina oxidasica]